MGEWGKTGGIRVVKPAKSRNPRNGRDFAHMFMDLPPFRPQINAPLTWESEGNPRGFPAMITGSLLVASQYHSRILGHWDFRL